MNTIDALCVICGRPMKWLSLTERAHPKCIDDQRKAAVNEAERLLGEAA